MIIQGTKNCFESYFVNFSTHFFHSMTDGSNNDDNSISDSPNLPLRLVIMKPSTRLSKNSPLPFPLSCKFDKNWEPIIVKLLEIVACIGIFYFEDMCMEAKALLLSLVFFIYYYYYFLWFYTKMCVRAADNSQSSVTGQPKFASVRQNPTCVQTLFLEIFYRKSFYSSRKEK